VGARCRVHRLPHSANISITVVSTAQLAQVKARDDSKNEPAIQEKNQVMSSHLHRRIGATLHFQPPEDCPIRTNENGEYHGGRPVTITKNATNMVRFRWLCIDSSILLYVCISPMECRTFLEKTASTTCYAHQYHPSCHQQRPVQW